MLTGVRRRKLVNTLRYTFDANSVGGVFGLYRIYAMGGGKVLKGEFEVEVATSDIGVVIYQVNRADASIDIQFVHRLGGAVSVATFHVFEYDY